MCVYVMRRFAHSTWAIPKTLTLGWEHMDQSGVQSPGKVHDLVGGVAAEKKPNRGRGRGRIAGRGEGRGRGEPGQSRGKLLPIPFAPHVWRDLSPSQGSLRSRSQCLSSTIAPSLAWCLLQPSVLGSLTHAQICKQGSCEGVQELFLAAYSSSIHMPYRQSPPLAHAVSRPCHRLCMPPEG